MSSILKVALEMADPTNATQFMYLIKKAKEFGLEEEWFQTELGVSAYKLKTWMTGMTPSIQERLDVYRAMTKAVEESGDSGN